MFEETTEDDRDSGEPRPVDELAVPRFSPEIARVQQSARRDKQTLDGLDDLHALVTAAGRIAAGLEFHPQKLEDFANAIQAEMLRLAAKEGYPITPRQRPPRQLEPPKARERMRSLVFIDECGSHHRHDRAFPYFAIAAVVIAEEDYAEVESRWRRWRDEWLLNPERPTHEPTLRVGNMRYSLKPGKHETTGQESLNDLLADLPFQLVAAVLDHGAYGKRYGGRAVDLFLPKDAYLMSFTFVLERLVHLLYHGSADRVGRVLADQRGRREDALLQREYQRLQIEGTFFLAPTWFRYQLTSHVRFKARVYDEVGLQIADLLARPVAEKYAAPTSSPNRWEIARAKLYQGGADTRPYYGLKIFPGDHARLGQIVGGKKNGDQP